MTLEREALALGVEEEHVEGVVADGGIGQDRGEPTHEEGDRLREVRPDHPEFECLSVGRLFKSEGPAQTPLKVTYRHDNKI